MKTLFSVEHSSHRFWVGATENPSKSDDWKGSSDKRCICHDVTSLKIHTLVIKQTSCYDKHETRGLYLFYPIFHCGLYCRVAYNAEWLSFHESFFCSYLSLYCRAVCNVWVKKTWTNPSSVSKLRFVQFFLTQTLSQETFLSFKIVKSGAGYNCPLTVLKNQKGSSSRNDFTPNSRLT